jgi:hypothetical protein
MSVARKSPRGFLSKRFMGTGIHRGSTIVKIRPFQCELPFAVEVRALVSNPVLKFHDSLIFH